VFKRESRFCLRYIQACVNTLDIDTAQECATFLVKNYGTQEGVTMDGFKDFVYDAILRDQDGMRQDLYNLGYKGYAP